MKKNGQLLTCDRCNASVFLKSTSTTFSGSQWINEFENTPAGWVEYTEIGDLCPACSKEYKQLKLEFLKTSSIKKSSEG